ncbi:MAG: hypothetical protein R3343_09725 [Nitriliruptorales bacterium]|nr:hypothetical protein [Nitriliruptorales bacterium]
MIRTCRVDGCDRPALWRVRFKVWRTGRVDRNLCKTHFNLMADDDTSGLRVVSARRFRKRAGR